MEMKAAPAEQLGFICCLLSQIKRGIRWLPNMGSLWPLKDSGSACVIGDNIFHKKHCWSLGWRLNCTVEQHVSTHCIEHNKHDHLEKEKEKPVWNASYFLIISVPMHRVSLSQYRKNKTAHLTDVYFS